MLPHASACQTDVPADFQRSAVQQGYVLRWPGLTPDEAEVALAMQAPGACELLSAAHTRGWHCTARQPQPLALSGDDADGVPLVGAPLASVSVPEQRPLPETAKRQWMEALASGRPLAELAAAPPHGFRRRALFDALGTHRVPLGRAAWCVRVVCLNQPPRAAQPAAGSGADAAAVSANAGERSRQWTSDLCECLAQLLPEAAAPRGEVEEEVDGAVRWQHAARVAAWTAGEGLVHSADLLEWVAANTRGSPDALRLLAPLLCAAAVGTTLAPQSTVRLLLVLRRVAAASDPHVSATLRLLVGDALVSVPHLFLCGGAQDAAALLAPAAESSLDLGAAPASARALEALARVRTASARLADVGARVHPCTTAGAVYAALDAALLSGDVDAACAAVFADGATAASCGRVALLCEWSVSEPWGGAELDDGPALSSARLLLSVELLKRAAAESTSKQCAPPALPPPLHEAVLAWAEHELQQPCTRAGRACTLLAAAAVAGVVSPADYLARAVAEGSPPCERTCQLLLDTLPVPGGDGSAEGLRYCAERAALLASFEQEPASKRLRRSTSGAQAASALAAAQLTSSNLLPVQEAVQALLDLPTAKGAVASVPAAVSVTQVAEQIGGLSPHARTRFAAWCGTLPTRAPCHYCSVVGRDSERVGHMSFASLPQAGCKRAPRRAGAARRL
jgi:hypothetical protein